MQKFENHSSAAEAINPSFIFKLSGELSANTNLHHNLSNHIAIKVHNWDCEQKQSTTALI